MPTSCGACRPAWRRTWRTGSSRRPARAQVVPLMCHRRLQRRMTWHGRFLGAAEDIGRLGFVLESEGSKFLFDYGMEPDKPPLYPLPAPAIDRVFLTHAHLDHSGMIPWLAARYDASVLCTPPTAEVATLMH